LQGLNFKGFRKTMNSSPETEFTMKPTNPNTTFKTIFTAVFCLTLTSGGAAFYLGSQPTLSPAENRLFDGANATWTMGTTTLIGLLTSQSGNDDEDEADRDDDEQ
jgi:hypothetical protein